MSYMISSNSSTTASADWALLQSVEQYLGLTSDWNWQLHGKSVIKRVHCGSGRESDYRVLCMHRHMLISTECNLVSCQLATAQPHAIANTMTVIRPEISVAPLCRRIILLLAFVLMVRAGDIPGK